MPRVSKKVQMKTTEQPTPVVEEKAQASTPSIERPPAHLIMVGMLVLVATSFVLGGRAFAGLKIVPTPQSQPAHSELIMEIKKLDKKIDALHTKLDMLDAQCDAVSNACDTNDVSNDDTFVEPEPLPIKQ